MTEYFRYMCSNNATVIDMTLSSICYKGDEELKTLRGIFIERMDTHNYMMSRFGHMNNLYKQYIDPLRNIEKIENTLLKKLGTIKHKLVIPKYIDTEDLNDKISLVIKELYEVHSSLNCTSNAEECVNQEGKNMVKSVKKVLYIAYSMLNIEYILKHNDLAPVDIFELLEKSTLTFDKGLIFDLIRIKKESVSYEEYECPDWIIIWVEDVRGKISKRLKEKRTTVKHDNDDYIHYYLDYVSREL